MITRRQIRPSMFEVVGATLALAVGYLVAGGGLGGSGGGGAATVLVDSSREPRPRTTGSTAAPATPSPRPSPSRAAARGVPYGLLAARGNVIWRWIGAQGCPGADSEGVLTRSADAGTTWGEVPAPGGLVTRLTAASAERAAATVLDEACSASVVTTADGGRAWEAVDASGSLSAVMLGNEQARWALHGAAVFRDVAGSFEPTPTPPCTGPDVGPASDVVALSDVEALVLCQRPDGAGRLLTRTRNGGQTWLPLAGKRAETGLDGPGRIVAISFADRDRGVVLLHGAGCPSGEIRTTTNAGVSWTAPGCPTVTGGTKVELVAVATTLGSRYVALGRTPAGIRTLRSTDGTTWTVEPA